MKTSVLPLVLLIIEDDVELSEAVAVSLKAEGYQVDLCHSGADAAYYYVRTPFSQNRSPFFCTNPEADSFIKIIIRYY